MLPTCDCSTSSEQALGRQMPDFCIWIIRGIELWGRHVSIRVRVDRAEPDSPTTNDISVTHAVTATRPHPAEAGPNKPRTTCQSHTYAVIRNPPHVTVSPSDQ